ncbi:uncharacterized protein LOC141600692 [Silene latifolia]|uniref:uncharacterized protein LOC141600692 n=1 Tax=Silene latifolia TaxID=37657 RepID=UPI003D76EDF2
MVVVGGVTGLVVGGVKGLVVGGAKWRKRVDEDYWVFLGNICLNRPFSIILFTLANTLILISLQICRRKESRYIDRKKVKSYLQIILESLPALEVNSTGQQAARLQELVDFIQSQVDAISGRRKEIRQVYWYNQNMRYSAKVFQINIFHFSSTITHEVLHIEVKN